MQLTIHGETVELHPRAEVMLELLVKHQHEIESHDHGEVKFSYHLGEVIMDVRTVRDRRLLSRPLMPAARADGIRTTGKGTTLYEVMEGKR